MDIGPSSSAGAQTTAFRRFGWLRQGLVAAAISAVGLLVAASVTAGSSPGTAAGVVDDSPAARQRAAGQLPPPPLLGPGTGSGAATRAPNRRSDPEPVTTGALAAFAPVPARADLADDAVRRAVVKERAAQRSEDLTEAAEDASRLTRTASQQARAKNLAATDQEIRETAVRIATERHQRALAARIAAEVARKRAEAAAAAAARRAAEPANDTADANTQLDTATDTSGNTGDTGVGDGVSPVPGAVVGTPFGATGTWSRYHTGLDFRAAQGTPVRAVVAGVVVYAGSSGDWAGNHVAIRHANGITSMSSHLSSIAVEVGQEVSAGQVIGRVGQTGRAFGPHLHFEVYPQGVAYGDIYRAVNPVSWLRVNGVATH